MFTKLNFIFKSKLWNRLGLINIWLMKKKTWLMLVLENVNFNNFLKLQEKRYSFFCTPDYKSMVWNFVKLNKGDINF